MNTEISHDEASEAISGRALNRNTYFQPTLSTFKNAIVLNYKKVGTRFMGLISSMPESFNLDKYQLDLYFHTHERPELKKGNNETYLVSNDFGTKNYVYTSFDVWENEMLNLNGDIEPDQTLRNYEGFNKFKTTSEFLNYENVKSINELLFENPHKDIVLVLRNPIRRYITGAVQILYATVEQIPYDELLRNDIKYFTQISDDSLRELHKILRRNDVFSNPKVIEQIDKEVLSKLLYYIVEKRPDYMFQDIHTQNYLRFYIDFINKIKDKTKIKIIDIDDCSSKGAYNFFDMIRGDNVVSNTFDPQQIKSESNKPLYNFFAKNFLGSDDFWRTSMRFYLEYEYYNYELLINSPYYIDLKKEGV